MRIDTFRSEVVNLATSLILKPFITRVYFVVDGIEYKAYDRVKTKRQGKYRLVNLTTYEEILIEFKYPILY